MGIVRKYNEQNQAWEPVASSDATGIYTDNPLLTSGTVNSIEDVLIRDRNDIELLKKNVSWLALHGGGGNGISGGGTSFTIEILDPSNQSEEISELIWSDSISAMYYRITSKGNSKYTVLVQIDGKTISTATGVKKNTIIAVSKNLLNIKKDCVFQVLAYDVSETMERAICNIKVASVNIDRTSMQCNVTQLAETNNYLEVSYYTSIQGDYTLYWSENPIMVSNGIVNIDTTLYPPIALPNITVGRHTYNANIVTQLGIPSNAPAGQYTRYLLLMNATNNTIYSSSTAVTINIILTNGILVSPLVISSPESPIVVSQGSIYTLPFVVYSGNVSTSTFSYRLYKADEEVSYDIVPQQIPITDMVSNNLFGREIDVQINPTAQNLDNGDFILYVYAITGLISDAKPVYFRITEPTSNFLTSYEDLIQNKVIYDYTFRKFGNVTNIIPYNNTTYHPSSYISDITVNSTLTLNNIGVDSGLTGGAYKFRHLAYGIINTNTTRIFPQNAQDTASLIMGSSNSFTIEIAYTIGKESSDDLVIYKLGDYDPVSSPDGHGIVVKSHGYYISFGGTNFSGDLEDNTFNQLNFIYFGNALGERYIYVYLNGKMLRAVDAGNNSVFDLYPHLNTYLAFDGNTSNLINSSTNVNYHAVKLYEGVLNAGQIACSYVNNYVSAHRNNDNSLNTELLSSMAANNGFNSDDAVEEGSDICSIYDMQNGYYSWNVTADSGGNVIIPEQMQKLPIPKVVLHVGWSYNTFTGQNLSTQTGCKFQYYQENSLTPVEGFATVEMQGTTSTMYEIKNLEITYENDVLFSPKPSWFPEARHTLKADISDSGHLNNAVIGKFINDCFNSDNVTSIMDVDSVYPTRRLIKQYQAANQLPENLTMKITVEGFPVLLIVKFTNEDNTPDVRVLGIYSFNLGRGAHYNQGYIVPKHLYTVNGDQLTTDVVMPGFFGIPPQSDIDTTYTAYCFEGTRSIDCESEQVALDAPYSAYYIVTSDSGESYKYSVITNDNGYVRVGTGSRLKDSEGNNIPYDAEHVKRYDYVPNGYFWSPDTTYATSLFDVVYAENSAEAIASFTSLNNYIATRFNYSKGGFIKEFGSVLNTYYIDSTDGDAAVRYKREGQTFTLTRPQARETLPISIKNTAFYYIVAMFFGLVDNFGKNMQMKKWKARTGIDETQWSPSFYDLDTALKLDNAGKEEISATMFDVSYINGSDGKITEVLGTTPQNNRSIPTVAINKLFGFDNAAFTDAYTTGFSEQYTQFSIIYNNLRKHYIKDIDTLMNSYFNTQLQSCGELILNYDYLVKYINTNQVDFLHGDRIGTIRNWLTERIAFLDSVFGYKAKDDKTLTANYLSDHIYNTSWENSIHLTHNSGSDKLTVTTNKSVIMRSVVGANDSYYTFVEKNVPTQIYVSNGIDINTIQVDINNSDCIIDIDGLDVLKLTAISANRVGNVKNEDGTVPDDSYNQYGTLSGLKRFDLTNVTTLNSEIDFRQLFATWDTTELGYDPEPFGLRSIILRNTKSSTTLPINLEMAASSHYKDINPFQNVIEIDVANSSASNINLPSNVSLYTFNVTNSNIDSVTLIRQPLLSSLDFNNCLRLRSVQLTNMDNLQNLSFDTTNTNLRVLTVSGLNNLSEIVINSDGTYKFLPNISIENCDSLDTIVINKWNPASEIATPSTAYLNLANVPALSRLDVSGSKISKIILDNPSILSNLNLSSSYVSIFGSSNIETLLNLSECKRNLVFNCSYNPEVISVNFGDNDYFIISSNETFRACQSLTTLLGKMSTIASYVFYDSTSLTNLSNLTDFKISGNATGLFRNTAVTREDVILVFSKILTNCTNISYMFSYCSNIIWNNSNPMPANLFENCINVSSIAYLFYANNSTGPYKINSPTYTNNTWSGGLLTPLANCTSIYHAFSGNYVVDRFIFAHSRTNKLTDIRGFTPSLIVDDVNNLNLSSIPSISSSTYINNYGNIENMFSYCDVLNSNFRGILRNTAYINYNSIKNSTAGLKLADDASIVGSFTSNYGNGDFILDKIFADSTQRQHLTKICNSFTISNKYNNVYATFNVTNNTFSEFPNLTSIAYEDQGNARIISSDYYGVNTAFGGDGMVKHFSEFPYDLLQSCPKLKQFTGFFYKATIDGGETISLPGTLFHNLPDLEEVSFTFYDFGNPYTLTSRGFKDSPKLSKVRYLFASDSFANSKITGMIPYELFYHGMKSGMSGKIYGQRDGNQTVDVTNINGNIATYTTHPSDNITETTTYIGFDIIDNDNTHIIIHPTTVVTKVREIITIQNNEEVTTTETLDPGIVWTTEEYRHTYSMPISTITDMEGCFSYANTDPYDSSDFTPTRIIYDTYNPFEYIYSSGAWTHPGKNLIGSSLIYWYDGNPNNLNTVEASQSAFIYNGRSYIHNVEEVDDIRSFNAINNIRDQSWNVSAEGYKLYIAPPDLLLYSTKNCKIDNLFAYSGVTGIISGYQGWATPFGIKGRICPYMFKPIPNTNSYKNVFINCKLINAIVDTTGDAEGRIYFIPLNLFKYWSNSNTTIDLTGMFSGVVIPHGTYLDVFTEASTSGVRTLQIGNIFYAWGLFTPTGRTETSTTVNRIFNSNKLYIDELYSAFDLDPYGNHSQSGTTSRLHSFNITFDSVFGNFNRNNGIKSDYYVFFGYKPGTTFNNCGPREGSPYNNYITFN